MLLTVEIVPSSATSKLTRGLPPWRERRSRHQQHPLLPAVGPRLLLIPGLLSLDTFSAEQACKQGVPKWSCLMLALLFQFQFVRLADATPGAHCFSGLRGSEVLRGRGSSSSAHHLICFHCLEVTSVSSQLPLGH